MRISLKLKRLLKKYTSYMRYDPYLEQANYTDGVALEPIYCIRESDMVGFIDGIIKLHEQTGFRKCGGTI